MIIFSGDTRPSDILESYAKDADILVHEVYSYAGFLNKTPDWQKYHKGHHTSTLELGEIAKRIKPNKLVLSHILFLDLLQMRYIKRFHLFMMEKLLLLKI